LSARRALLSLVAIAAVAAPARAQLLSPGPLTRAHASLEGVRNCTSCHRVGQRGIDPAKCLSCHTPIRTRIAARRGLHARLSRDCGSCHRDHFGRDFDPIRFDTRNFDHSRTGFELVGRHTRVQCRSCHRPDFISDAAVRRFVAPAGHLDDTFLGLGRACQACHSTDSPHGNAFRGQDCATCHSAEGWGRARADFDHSATGFPLAGAHARLDCASCHGETRRFTGLSSTCRSCHRDDSPHGAQFAARDCDACHAPAQWDGAARFSHARTSFPLVGEHVRVACASCHAGAGAARRYEGVAHATCESCHDDPHEGVFGADCRTCHTPTGWGRMAQSFDASRIDHEELTGFALVGAHASLDCASCHGDPRRPDDGIRMTFTRRDGAFPAPAHETCGSCHTDYHAGAFADNPRGSDCESCHAQAAWVPAQFDLARHQEETRFPLTGAHVATPCSACHGGRAAGTIPNFTLAVTCEGCHANENPHGDTFAEADGVTACGSCHATSGWASGAFDHSETDFPLTGAHGSLECASCHERETGTDGRPARQFRGLDMACASCHADDQPHRDQFAGRTCDACHDTRSFTLAAFNHATTRFPLEGPHARVSCGSCHRTESDAAGTFVRFRPLGTACADCHANGP